MTDAEKLVVLQDRWVGLVTAVRWALEDLDKGVKQNIVANDLRDALEEYNGSRQ